MQQQGYVFGNTWEDERRRLGALEAGWDGVTASNLELIGVTRGWRCAEVGAGGGSVARWLADRVGTDGHVVATDLEPGLLESIDAANIEVRQHDITVEPLEVGSYDLVHARLLLEHLPQHEAALDHMIKGLRPGGWLLVEDFDHSSFLPDPASSAAYLTLWGDLLRAFAALSERRGLDLAYGRRLLGLFQSRGLESVTAEGRLFPQVGGSSLSEALALSIAKMQDGLAATGEADTASLQQLIVMLRAPEHRWMSQLMVSAKGRKPADGQ